MAMLLLVLMSSSVAGCTQITVMPHETLAQMQSRWCGASGCSNVDLAGSSFTLRAGSQLELGAAGPPASRVGGKLAIAL